MQSNPTALPSNINSVELKKKRKMEDIKQSASTSTNAHACLRSNFTFSELTRHTTNRSVKYAADKSSFRTPKNLLGGNSADQFFECQPQIH